MRFENYALVLMIIILSGIALVFAMVLVRCFTGQGYMHESQRLEV
jgi:hypothetical protein